MHALKNNICFVDCNNMEIDEEDEQLHLSEPNIDNNGDVEGTVTASIVPSASTKKGRRPWCQRLIMLRYRMQWEYILLLLWQKH